MQNLRVVLSGIDGDGANYLNVLLDRAQEMGVTLAGVVQQNLSNLPKQEAWLRARGIPVAANLHQFFHQLSGQADLVIVASPTQYHFEQCYEAIQHGCHVLCEKPAVSDYHQAEVLEKLAAEKGVQLAVGYQQCFSDAMLCLKRDVSSGRYGRAVSMRASAWLAKSDQAYGSTPWMGHFFDAEGRCVQGGVLHQTASQYLHAMLYLLGDELDAAADICTVRGEWCRTRAIDSYDTAVVRLETRQCPQVLFAATYAWAGRDQAKYRFIWEHGWCEGDAASSHHLVMHMEDHEVDYGQWQADASAKLRMVLDCIRTGRRVPCGITAAKAEVAVCNGLYLSAGPVRTLPENELTLVRGAPGTAEDGAIYTTAPALTRLLDTCWQKGCLPAELGQTLGRAPREVPMEVIRLGIPRED